MRLARALAVFLMIVLVAGVAVARLRLAHTLNVNWDEFYFLSKVFSYARGELNGNLLTFHVHLLGWVADPSGSEVDQVLRIRDVMLAVGAVGAIAAFFISRKLTGSTVGALFAVFAAQSFSNVLNHGASARFDPVIVTCFLVAGALIVKGPSLWAPLLAGASLALGLLVSIKSAFYLLPFIGIFGVRALWGDRKAELRSALLFAAGLLLFVPLFAWHTSSLASSRASSLADPSGGRTAAGSGALSDIFNKVMNLGVPQEKTLTHSLHWDWAFWVAFAAGVAFAMWGIRCRSRRLAAAQLLCFSMPMVALLFYRNSFPYFYVSVIPASALLVGYVVGALNKRLPLVAVVVIAAPMARGAYLWTSYNGEDQLSAQREIVDAVHTIFPEPVPYIDRCAMIGSFKKVGPFMSTWRLSEYRKTGEPVMGDLLRSEGPQFLVQNISSLELSREAKGGSQKLLPQDAAVLRKSFVPYWGPIWVAGTTTDLDAAPKPVEVLIGGRYLLDQDVTVDQTALKAGDVVNLTAGLHEMSASQPTKVTLRTATAHPPPAKAPPTGKVFVGFTYRTRQAAAVDDDDP